MLYAEERVLCNSRVRRIFIPRSTAYIYYYIASQICGLPVFLVCATLKKTSCLIRCNRSGRISIFFFSL